MRQVLEVLKKDLLIEWRARTRAMALACFAVTVLLLFSFAIGPDIKVLRAHASAYLWMALLLSSTLLLARSMQTETESGALETILLLPTSPAALFYGKALSNALQLIVIASVAIPATIAIYDPPFRESPLWLVVTVVLGSAGLAAPGTLYAGLTARVSARQLLLPLLLFPLVVPALLAATKATSLAMGGDAMDEVPSWTALLLAFDLVYWSLCGVLFGRAISA